MSGFEERVEQARRELAGTGGAERAPAGSGTRLKVHLDSQARFKAELARLCRDLEANVAPFDLRADAAMTVLRRAVARVLAGVLRVGGLGKHLGANQLRANQAILVALRLLQARMLEQDRVLSELAAALDKRSRSADPDGPQG